MQEQIDIKAILDLLPHRYPFILVDRVLDYKVLDYLIAIKNVSMNEPFFQGHFPGNPVMPGVLILEALAQASAVLSNLSVKREEDKDYLYLFAGIDKAKFKQIVLPGDQLRLEVKLINQKGDFSKLEAKAYVAEKLACSAQMLSVAKEIKRVE